MIEFNISEFQFVYYGIYFGYKPCCINHFVNRIRNNDFSDNKEYSIISGTGLVPCATHRREFNSVVDSNDFTITIEDYFTDRLHVESFPKSSDDDDTVTYDFHALGLHEVTSPTEVINILSDMNPKYYYLCTM